MIRHYDHLIQGINYGRGGRMRNKRHPLLLMGGPGGMMGPSLTGAHQRRRSKVSRNKPNLGVNCWLRGAHGTSRWKFHPRSQERKFGDQTGLSRTMGRLGSRWSCLRKNREILEPSPQPPPSCLSSPPPPSHVPRGGLRLREGLRTGFQENPRVFQQSS